MRADARTIPNAKRKNVAHESERGDSELAMAEDDFRPYVIERPGARGRIKLGPEAKFWAQQHGMSLQEMAKYLLARDEGAEPSGESEDF